MENVTIINGFLVEDKQARENITSLSNELEVEKERVDTLNNSALNLNNELQTESERIDDVYNDLEEERQRISELNTELEVERQRINTLTSLPSGSTSGDAELIDIRVGADGNTYSSAGDSVRSQINNCVGKYIKNIINFDTSEVNKYISTSSGYIADGSGYETTDFIPIKAGQSISVSPRCRKFLAYNSSKSAISSTYQNDEQTNYTFTASEDGYVRLTYEEVDKDIIQIEYGDQITKYVPPLKYLIEDNVYMSDTLYNEVKDLLTNIGLQGKKIVNFGDSIAEYRTESINYANQLKDKINGVLLHDYAYGGATLSRVSGQSMRSILSQVDEQISNNPNEEVDIILLNGGANDYGANRELGTIVKTSNHYEISDYDSTFDETTYLGALESCFKKLRATYLDSVIVFVIPHKHTRLDDTWESMLEGAREVCKKWGIAILDMDKDGELNTRIEEMRTLYTDEGGTHQNTLGNAKYYVPQLINLLNKYFN